MKLLKLILITLAISQMLFADKKYDLAEIIFDDTQLAEIYITISPDTVIWLNENVQSDRYFRGTMRYVNNELDTTVENIGFRLRGNTSRNAEKKSFKVSFNEFESGRRFYGLKKFNLNGEHNDPSIIRSKLCFDLFEKMNVDASRVAHAKVYINDEYFGLYANIEHYDDIFLDTRFDNDIGNFYKCLWPADLTWRGEDAEEYKFEHGDKRTYDLKTNEDYDDYSDIVHLIKIINRTSDYAFADSIHTYLDVWSMLKSLSIEVLTGSWDNYWFLKNNFYLYNNSQSGRFTFVPYDFDNSFGISWFHDTDWGSQNIYSWGNSNERPLVENILKVQEFRDLYSFFVDHLLQNHFNSAVLSGKIDSLKTMITPAAEEDLYRTMDYGFSIDDFNNSITSAWGNHVTYGIKNYISTRYSSAASQVDKVNLKPFPVTLPRVKFLGNNSVQIKIDIFDESKPVEAGMIVEFNGAIDSIDFELYEVEYDGNLTKYEYIKILEIPAPEFYYFIYAIDSTGKVGTFPFKAPNSVLSITFPNQTQSICINEILASNDSIIADSDGDFEDWVELYNRTDDAINLKGYYLTDNPQNLKKWAFPDTDIEPGEFLLVWTDSDEGQDGLHTNFKLDKDGEFLAITQLSDFGTMIIDSVTFSEQTTDISYGRSPDGGDNWTVMHPTPSIGNYPVSIDEKPENIATNFILHQNFPNPFNPSTQIDFYLSQSENVKLTVYNILGKKIKTLVNTKKNIGNYSVVWNGMNDSGVIVPAGIYFYRLDAGKQSMMMKMLFVK